MALPFGLKTGLTAKTNVGIIGADGKREDVEYSARCLAHAVVYQKNGKPIKTDEVDPRIKEQLIGTMLAGAGAGVQAEIEAPAETSPQPVPEEIAEAWKEEDKVVVDEAENLSPEALEEIARIAPQIEGGKVIMARTEVTDNKFPEIVGEQPDDLGFDSTPAPEINYEELLAEAEARSVDNANLKELVDALYRRFRIYLPYVNQPPQRSDISPLTGSVMNALTYGQSVQGFKTAQRLGTSWNPAVIRTQLESARSSSQDAEPMPPTPEEANQSVQPFHGQEVNMPNLHGEPEPRVEYRVNRRYDSPHQSAVRSERGKEADGLDSDEYYAEPPINAQSSIVRPFVVNKRSQAKLEEINRQRMSTVPQGVGFDQLV